MLTEGSRIVGLGGLFRTERTPAPATPTATVTSTPAAPKGLGQLFRLPNPEPVAVPDESAGDAEIIDLRSPVDQDAGRDHEAELLVESEVIEDEPEAVVESESASTFVAAPSGLRAKAAANLEAIRVLQQVEADGRAATDDERSVLSQWSSWGALPKVFDDNDVEWVDERAALRALLSDAAWDAARRTTINAHYTPPGVVDAMWEAVQLFGFDRGMVLEPGCGSGNFLSAAPAGCDLTGVELDPTTAGIAALLHPKAAIRCEGFERTAFPDEWFDLAIGNVPFGAVALHDPRHNAGKHTMHNHFLVKSLRLLAPGGIAALITSRYTLDSQNASHRVELAGLADLIGAVRLPNGAMKATAGTDVVVDVLFFRRRPTGRPSQSTVKFEKTVPLETPDGLLAINEYFAERPHLILGELGARNGMYRDDDMTVKPFDRDVVGRLRNAVARLHDPDAPMYEPDPDADVEPEVEAEVGPQTAKERRSRKPRRPAMRPRSAVTAAAFDPAQHQEGSILRTADRGFCQLVEGVLVPFTPTSKKDEKELVALIDLRDTVLGLLAAQAASVDDTSFAALQAELNERYDDYVGRFGPLNRFTLAHSGKIDDDGEERMRRLRPRMGGFGDDPAFHTVLALEHFDADNQTAAKADIFSRRVVGPREARTAAETPEDAMAICLDELGVLDLARVGELLDCSEADARVRLGHLVFDDPVAGQVVPRADYLSGNVRQKLAAARAVAAEDDRWTDNVAALEAVMPADLGPDEIDTRLGAPWLQVDDVEAFIKETFVQSGYSTWSVSVEHSKINSTWEVSVDRWLRNNLLMTSTWGTPRADAITLLGSSLNQTPHVVYDTVETPEGTKRVVNQDETFRAREKQEQIEARFQDWVWEDDTRKQRIVAEYNRLFNSTVLPKYDGSHLSLPGINLNFHPHPHQKDAVWRIIQSPTVGLFHPVGAGKTAVATAAALEMRRLGLAKKPAMVVPNHMLEQFATEMLQLYPQARILVPTKKDMTPGGRRQFVARCAMGDWDAVVLTHSAFERIPVSPTTAIAFLEGEIDAFRAAKAESTSRMTIKKLEASCIRMEQKLLTLLALEGKDDGVNFEATGIDYVFVDECFPWETLITTDRGLIPIGRIVDEAMDVRILSLSLATGTLQWQPINRWVKKPVGERMVRVTHESGSFTCTPNHPIWIEGEGYVRADQLTRGAELRVVRDAVQTGHEARPGASEVLHRPMCTTEAGDRPETNVPSTDLPNMSGDVRAELRVSGPLLEEVSAEAAGNGALCLVPTSVPQAAHERRDTAVLRQVVFGQVADEPARRPGQSGGTSRRWSDGRRAHLDGRGAEGAVGTHAPVESDEQTRREGEGLVFEAGSSVDVSAWRQRHNDRAPTIAGRTAGAADGIHYSDPASGASVRVSPELLLRRLGAPGVDGGDRSRRELPQGVQTTGTGHAEDDGLGSSRVVSVEILERGGAHGDGASSERDRFVYNLEVDVNHNYFADGVLVSNCQAHKNLQFPTHIRSVGGAGSQRASDLDLKLRFLRSKVGDRVATFCTATPIANTIAEMFVVQKYLQPDRLADAGIANFDAWAAAFGSTVTALELAPDGGSYRMNTRFARFHNVPELVTMFREIADVMTPADLNLPIPAVAGGKAATVIVDSSDELRDYVGQLVERAKAVRNRMVDPREDNMLKVCGDGRKAALDLRLVDLTPDPAGGKIVRCAVEVARAYHQHATVDYIGPDGEPSGRPGAFQIVFCDLGTPRDGWNVYQQLVDEMVARGMPRDMIRFVHDAVDARSKAELFAACRAGRVAVLIGSTEKMGVGTNVQTRMVALHHLDCPWRPDQIEQREGRGLRQGNQNATVAVHRYATEGSFDVYMWQTVERKANFIYQVMRGEVTAREVDDISEQALSYAEIKALATGNPLIMEKAGVDNDVARLLRLRQAHNTDQGHIARRLGQYRTGADLAMETIDKCEEALEKRQIPNPFEMTVDGEHFTERAKAGLALIDQLQRVAGRGTTGTEHAVGTFAGFTVTAACERRFVDREIALRLADSPISRRYLVRELAGLDALGMTMQLENSLRNLDVTLEKAEADLAKAIADIQEAESRQGVPFDQEQLLAGLLRRQASLEEELAKLERKDDEAAA